MTAFPANVTLALKEELAAVEGATNVVGRTLRPTDVNGSVGVYPSEWNPGEAIIGQHVPVTSRYLFHIQSFTKHLDEVEGISAAASLANGLLAMLYQGESLRLRLASLTETVVGVRKRAQRWGVARQTYLSEEIQSTFLYMSTTEFWIEVESLPIP